MRTTGQATEDEMEWVMDVNFKGVVRCIKAVLAHMRERRTGHIVNITSVGSKQRQIPMVASSRRWWCQRFCRRCDHGVASRDSKVLL